MSFELTDEEIEKELKGVMTLNEYKAQVALGTLSDSVRFQLHGRKCVKEVATWPE